MGLNNDVIQMVWRHIPALIMILSVILRLANQSEYQRSLAIDFNVHATRDDYTKGDK
jgi:hypothetical protein